MLCCCLVGSISPRKYSRQVVVSEADVEREPWGELEPDEEAEYEEAEPEEGAAEETPTEPDFSGLATPIEG